MVVGHNGQNGLSVYVGIKIEREHAHSLHLQMEDYLALIPTWSIYCVSQPIGMVSKNDELMAKWPNYSHPVFQLEPIPVPVSVRYPYPYPHPYPYPYPYPYVCLHLHLLLYQYQNRLLFWQSCFVRTLILIASVLI